MKLAGRILMVVGGVAIALQLVAPFIAVTEGVDSPCLLWWDANFWLMLKSGIVFPHWINAAYCGLGAPSLYFYPPLMFYESAVVHAFTGISDGSRLFQMTGLVATIGSFFTARLLLNRIAASRWQANLGAAIFAFAPYRVAELYNRSASAHFGYFFLPLVWYAILLIFDAKQREQRKGILYLGVTCALLLLSNIPLMVLSAVTIILAGIAEWRQLSWRVARDFTLGGMLSLALVAFYLIPVLQYRPYSHLEQVWLVNGQTRNPGYFIGLLLRMEDLAALYHIGMIYIGIVAVAFAYYRARVAKGSFSPQEVHVVRIAVVVCAAIVFVQIPRISLPVWEHLPGFGIIQGGWRFYIDVVLLVSLLMAVARGRVLQRMMLAVAMVWAVATIYPMLLVVQHKHVSKHIDGRPAFDAPEYTSVYAPFVRQSELEALVDRHAVEPEVLPWGNLTTGEALVAHARQATSQTIEANLSQTRRVTFHRFYWPAWHLYDGNTQLRTWPDSIGRTVADMPNGHYQAEWKLEKSWQERAGYWISGTALIACVSLLGIGLLGSRVRAGTSKPT